MDDYITRDEFERYKERDEDKQGRSVGALGAKLDDLKQYITEEFKELRSELAEKYATKEDVMRVEKRAVMKAEFDPVRRLVYGAVGIILMAVMGAIVALVLIT
jgi:hypothetical protein